MKGVKDMKNMKSGGRHALRAHWIVGLASLAFGVTILDTTPRAIDAESAVQAAGRRLAIEDYYRIQTVGNPQFSPDSRWILFSVSTRVESDNGTRSESHVVPVDASAPARRVQHDGKDVSAAAWTPENKIRYTVGAEQWAIDPAAPAAPPVKVERPAAPAGGGGRGGGRGGGEGGGPIASPDGKWAVALRDTARPAGPARALTEFERRHDERFRGAIFDWMKFQRDGQPFPAPNLSARPAQQVVLQPAEGGAAPRVLVNLDIRPTSLAWHPSGSLIAFLADTSWRDELKYERPDIFTVTLDGTLTRLTDDGYVYSDLEISPDGNYFSYARSFGTDMIIEQKLNDGGPRDLFVRPVNGSEPINLTVNWDLDPGDARWSPDSRFLYFTAGIGGETHLFRVAVPDVGQLTTAAGAGSPPSREAPADRRSLGGGGSRPSSWKVEQVTKGPRRLNGVVYNRSFTMIAYTVGRHEAPPEIHVSRLDGTNERRLTDVHRDIVREIAFSKAERLRWPSHDGTTIEGWLMFPYGYDKSRGPYPLIVFSHGGPHSATGYSFDFKKQWFAANGYFVLDTNFRSSTGYGDAFKWATWGAWGDKDGQDVMSGIDHVIKSYPIDPKRVGHTGHSYGGFLTNWLITQYPDRFAAAVSGAGISNWISDYGTADIYRTKETEFFGPPWDEAARNRMIKQSPITYAWRVRTPTLFVHGEVDQRVPYEEAEQMYFALKRRGVPAKMIRYAGQPHGIGGHWNNVHRMLNELRWWETYLKGATQ